MPDDDTGLPAKFHDLLESKLKEHRETHAAELDKLQKAHDAAVAEIEKIKGKQTQLEEHAVDVKVGEKRESGGSTEDQKKNEIRSQKTEKLNAMAESLNRQIER